jgi:crotonobetainyl-CoA:carnitine CoA-transferase CaiB-like acyl-CoA transferase
MLLADEGAEVVKVEPPQGEQSRARAPYRTSEQGTVSAYYASLNRRKKSIALDLKSSGGMDVMRRLLADADVFVTNMRPQALERLGIHPDVLRRQYPSLIIANITGFGLHDAGDNDGRAGLAMVAEALSGSTGLTRDRNGMPVWCGFALGDIAAATTAHTGILLALRKRDQTGDGHLIDVALTECTLPFVSVALSRVQSATDAAGASGSNTFHGVPYGTFEASDGYYNIGVNRDPVWFRLCEAIGRPELAHDPRYETYSQRSAHKKEVEEILEAWSRALPRDEVLRRIEAADVPVAPVLTVPEVIELDHYRERGIFIETDDGIGGTLIQPTDPTGFAVSTPARVPHLGEYRDEVLRRLGLDDGEIAEMAGAGAFGAPPDTSVTAPSQLTTAGGHA